ncbi:MFS transporter [Leucothrix sargassi]|nr:MFS transporter [Leucothrix sargassi]
MHPKIIALMLAQSCFMFSGLISISLSSIIGMKLAPHESLATLPFGLLNLGALLFAYKLSLIMQQYGRRTGLRLGAAAGTLAALLAMLALSINSFYIFCFACFLLGIYQASAMYYRLAAMDEAPAEKKGSVMGWVLSGSLIAAILGPTLNKYANQWISEPQYLGAYLCVGIFSTLAIVMLGSVANQPVVKAENHADTKRFLKSPSYLLGAFNTAFAQFSMLLMMSITPLAMHAHHYSVEQSVSVIGWHIIGMFLPSFFSGKLIDRFGPKAIILTGLAIFMGSTLVAMSGMVISNFYISLFLLGLGWNFMYMGGTASYTQSIDEEEKGKAQGMAELSVALGGVVAVLIGGILINWFEWQRINQGLLLVLALTTAMNVLKRAPQANTGNQ